MKTGFPPWVYDLSRASSSLIRVSRNQMRVGDRGYMSFFNDIKCMMMNANVMVCEWMQCDAMYFFFDFLGVHGFKGPR